MSDDRKPVYLSGRWQGPGVPRLLLVDDDPMARRAMVRFLSRAGFEVVSVGSGRAALTLIDDGEPFDAVVVDLDMPGMDGLTVIRELYTRRPELPAGLWSGSARLDELTPEELVHARFVKHKLQPIGELVQAVCMMIYGARERAGSDGPTERSGSPGNGGRGSNGDGHNEARAPIESRRKRAYDLPAATL